LELHLIGTGTCTPVIERTPACYFLDMGPRKIIIDPGPGAVNRIKKHGLDPFSASAIFLSHHHLDHCADLLPYLFSYKYCSMAQSAQAATSSSSIDVRKLLKPRPDPLIVAPEGFKKIYAGLMEVFGDMIHSDEYQVKIEEVLRTEWQWPDGLRFRAAPMAHFITAVGYRFQKPDGPSLAYSGDTGLCPELVDLATGADALLVECALPDNLRMDGHMCPSDIARAAIDSGVKKLILTHFYPQVNVKEAVDTIRSAGYQGEIIAGEDGMTVTI